MDKLFYNSMDTCLRRYDKILVAKICLLMLLIAPLSSCGFSPIYADKEVGVSAKEHLGAIIVASPKSKRGQFFQYAIQDRLSPKGEKYNPRYRLHTDLKLDEQPIIIEQNGEIRRYRIMIESPFTLVGLADGKVVYRGKIKRTVSYNVADNDYSTYIASENAVDDGLTELAKDFEQRLASFFTNYEKK